MSKKKNKKKKINKIIKEVERKREVGFNSLINSGCSLVSESTCDDAGKTLSKFIDQWENKNIRILLTTFFNEYMNQDYGIELLRWNYTADKNYKINSIINLINKKNEDERVSYYMLFAESTNNCFGRSVNDECKKKGKYCFMLERTKIYRDPKTKHMMENQVHGFTFLDEL